MVWTVEVEIEGVFFEEVGEKKNIISGGTVIGLDLGADLAGTWRFMQWK